MNNILSVLSASLLAASPLYSQAPERPAPAPSEPLTAVTIILRHSGSNIPEKFTTYMAGGNGHVTMPLHDPADSGWVAEINAALGEGKKPVSFDLYIQDTSRLESRSSELTPFSMQPINVITVELPVRFGSEIPIYKSPNLAVSIEFEALEE